MEMEVVVPLPAVDFNFDSSACSSPYMTAPSSPQRFGNFFFSAPTSPSRASSSFYRDLNDVSYTSNSSSAAAVPFAWEDSPGTPKNRAFSQGKYHDDDDGGEDFEFNFSGQLERTSLSADELFDGGKIRPLKPPPCYDSPVSSVSSPKSPKSRASQKKEFDPFAAAIEETRRREEQPKNNTQQRGRERISGLGSSFVRKGSRSLSPMRVSDIMFDQEENLQSEKVSTTTSTTSTTATPTTTTNPKSYASSIMSAISFSKGYRKWKLKDFLLFRSASEGRAGGKDPLGKYTVLSKKEVVEDVKNASFRSTDSSGSRRRGPVSAHELHYQANRAVSEEMRRKTYLPYKQGLLGCLGFNPGVHEISRGIGSLTRG